MNIDLFKIGSHVESRMRNLWDDASCGVAMEPKRKENATCACVENIVPEHTTNYLVPTVKCLIPHFMSQSSHHARHATYDLSWF